MYRDARAAGEVLNAAPTANHRSGRIFLVACGTMSMSIQYVNVNMSMSSKIRFNRDEMCTDTRVAVLPVADQKGCGERNIQPLHSYSIVGSWNYGTPFVFMKLKRDTW